MEDASTVSMSQSQRVDPHGSQVEIMLGSITGSTIAGSPAAWLNFMPCLLMVRFCCGAVLDSR